jgi:hypothetical protein
LLPLKFWKHSGEPNVAPFNCEFSMAILAPDSIPFHRISLRLTRSLRISVAVRHIAVGGAPNLIAPHAGPQGADSPLESDPRTVDSRACGKLRNENRVVRA